MMMMMNISVREYQFPAYIRFAMVLRRILKYCSPIENHCGAENSATGPVPPVSTLNHNLQIDMRPVATCQMP